MKPLKPLLVTLPDAVAKAWGIPTQKTIITRQSVAVLTFCMWATPFVVMLYLSAHGAMSL